MARLALKLACGPYDRTIGLGSEIAIAGADVTYISIQSPPEIFDRMINGREFDVSEMSATTYLSARARGNFPFVAIPVFPSRVFRHGYIFVNKNAGISQPKDLEGRRVGMTGYRQTAAVWIRGMMKEDYGVDLSSIRWVEGGSDSPFSGGGDEVRVPSDIKIDSIPRDVALSDLLANGEIDALISARRPASFGVSPNVARLFPNYREVEREYFRKTGIFPIMHTIVIREELCAQYAWLATSVFNGFCAAKDLAHRQMRFSGAMRYALPWMYDDIEEIDDLFRGDPFPYGLAENRTSLTVLARYLLDQGFVDAPIDIDGLFATIMAEVPAHVQ